jgi:hypothetical protein
MDAVLSTEVEHLLSHLQVADHTASKGQVPAANTPSKHTISMSQTGLRHLQPLLQQLQAQLLLQQPVQASM